MALNETEGQRSSRTAVGALDISPLRDISQETPGTRHVKGRGRKSIIGQKAALQSFMKRYRVSYNTWQEIAEQARAYIAANPDPR